MAYSPKHRWMMQGGGFAFLLVGAALIFTAKHNHFNHPVIVLSLFTLLVMAAGGMAMRAISYMDEVQRQTEQIRWFWGSLIGLIAVVPAMTVLQHAGWLEAATQFIFRHPGNPHLYFGFGLLVPIVLQVVAGLVLKLLGNLPCGSKP